MGYDSSEARQCILIIDADLPRASHITSIMERLYPTSTVVRERLLSEANKVIKRGCAMVVTTMDFQDGDVLTFLPGHTESTFRSRHVMVLGAYFPVNALAVIEALEIAGVVDTATDSDDEVLSALVKVGLGERYRSESIRARLQQMARKQEDLGRVNPIGAAGPQRYRRWK